MATADDKMEAFGKKLAAALARANGHPDPAAYAAAVAEHLKAGGAEAVEPAPETSNG